MKKLGLFIFTGVFCACCLGGFFLWKNNQPKKKLYVPADPLKEAAAAAGYNSLKSTIPGLVLLWGWVDDGYAVNYDSSTLTDQEKEHFTQVGLQVLSNKFNKPESFEDAIYCCEVLALFYHKQNKNDVKKYLYWNLKGAEKGSTNCMLMLSDAYKGANGVVTDLEESLKWKLLAAAAGDEDSKKWIKEDWTKWMSDKQAASMMNEGQKRAKAWADTHKDLFFNPL